MSKRQLFLLCAIVVGTTLIYQRLISTTSSQNYNQVEEKPKTQILNKNFPTWQSIANKSIISSPPQSSIQLKTKYIMASSYIFPFVQNSATSSSNLNWSSAPKIDFQPGLKIMTYDNLDNFATGNTSSTFTCPPDTPFAESYTLANSTSNMSSYIRGYRNACIFGGAGKAFSDILYGDDQHVDPNHGSPINMSAFIPNTTPEGCNLPEYNFLTQITIPESSILVTPIYADSSLESQIIGYSQTQQVQPNCLSICTSLVKTYCEKFGEALGYCNNIVVNAYLKKSIYLARNIPENFCSCGTSFAGSTYIGTIAADVESLVNYSNPLRSVTCSNYSTRD